MTETSEQKVQDRLTGLRKPPPKPSILKSYVPYAVVLAAGLGIGGYVASIPAAEEEQPAVRTSDAAEFQEDVGLAGFTTRVPRAQPAVEMRQAEPEHTAADPEAEQLRAELAELQAQMEALKNQPAETPPELAALQAEMDSLRAEAADRENAYAETLFAKQKRGGFPALFNWLA